MPKSFCIHTAQTGLQIRITLMQIRIQIFTSMQIQILLLIKVTRICDHGPAEPPGFHFEPPRLNCERSRLYFEPDF
jgi:hypothetical protein